jgi:hypothetical protein
MRPLIPVFILCAACSSSSASTTPPQPNPCAIKGATYAETLAIQSGTPCTPPLDGGGSAQVVLVSATGVVTTAAYGVAASCGMSTTPQGGCATTNSDCSYSSSNQTCTLFTELTFAADGGTLTGTETIGCTNHAGNSCMSTYDVKGAVQAP